MKTVYLLPGTMCTDLLWQELLPILNPSIRWQPIPLPSGNSFKEMAEELLKILPQNNINLVGFSLGGYLSAYLATNKPNIFKKLSIISNTPYPLADSEMLQRKQAIAWLEKYNYQGITTEKALSYIDQDNLSSEKIASVVAAIKQMDNVLGGEVLLQQLQATSVREDLANPLLTSKTDIHFVCSEQDPLVNFDWLNKLTQQSENITASIVDGKGHMLPLEQPQLIADTLNQYFLES